jgi:hypothetical protein
MPFRSPKKYSSSRGLRVARELHVPGEKADAVPHLSRFAADIQIITLISPESGFSRVEMQRRVVVFPAPFGPQQTVDFPGSHGKTDMVHGGLHGFPLSIGKSLHQFCDFNHCDSPLND